MRSVFSQQVKDKRVKVAEGTFDSTGIADGWADLVVLAQVGTYAFIHRPSSQFYRRPIIGVQTMTQLRQSSLVSSGPRVLSPLFGIWRTSLLSIRFMTCSADLLTLYRDGARWVSQVWDILELHEQNTPQPRHTYWRQTFDTPSYRKGFNPPEEKIWNYNLQATKEIVVDRASSESYVAVLSDDKKAELQEEIREIVDEGLDKVWIDETQGLFEYPYKTWVVIAHKK